jgi:hypothetical protein
MKNKLNFVREMNEEVQRIMDEDQDNMESMSVPMSLQNTMCKG